MATSHLKPAAIEILSSSTCPRTSGVDMGQKINSPAAMFGD